MPSVYWWNDGVEATDWDNADNWWDDATHTTPHSGGAPIDVDDVFFVGSIMPTTAPATPVSLNTIDTNGHTDPGPWTGFDDAAITANVVATGTLTWGKTGDVNVAAVWGGTVAASASAVVFRGAVVNEGAIGNMTTFNVDFHDLSINGPASAISGSHSGTINFYDNSTNQGSINVPGAVVTLADSSQCEEDVTALAFTMQGTSVLSDGLITASSFTLTDGTIAENAGVVIQCTDYLQQDGAFHSGDLNATASIIVSGGDIGDGATLAPTINGSTTASMTLSSTAVINGADIFALVNFTMSAGEINAVPATSINCHAYTQTGGVIAGFAGDCEITAGIVTLTTGQLNTGRVTSSGDATIGAGYHLEIGGSVEAAGTITVDQFVALEVGNAGLTGTTVIIKGKPTPSNNSYIKQSGILRMPDFTRGKSPFGGGCFN